MRQIALMILGLVLLATGSQGVIRLLLTHNPGALRHVPGGFPVRLLLYAAIAVYGLTMARRNRVHPDPEHDPDARYR
jgi:hypothetical protein